jgi:hypothetical protein
VPSQQLALAARMLFVLAQRQVWAVQEQLALSALAQRASEPQVVVQQAVRWQLVPALGRGLQTARVSSAQALCPVCAVERLIAHLEA